jgi:hypothetical protein
MMRYFKILVIALLGVSCVRPDDRTTTQPIVEITMPETDWSGVYASTSEVGDFTGTVLMIEKGSRGKLDYRLTSYSCTVSEDTIPQDEHAGHCLTDGNVLYLPKADGYMYEGKPKLLAFITRFTRVEVNGHTVLMRDDALRAFRSENKLYDYGLLVKLKTPTSGRLDLHTVEHPSVKVLYTDPTKPWNDPFLYGANSR